MFITGEVVIMRCITANSAWVVEYDGRVPAYCWVRNDDSTTDTINATVFGKVSAALATVVNNDHTIWSTANKRIDIRRAGIYNICGNTGLNAQVAGKYVITALYKNGTAVVRGMQGSPGATQSSGSPISALLKLAVDDYIEMYIYNGDSAS